MLLLKTATIVALDSNVGIARTTAATATMLLLSMKLLRNSTSLTIIIIILISTASLYAQEKEPPGFWGIPFGTYETDAIQTMLEMDSVEVYDDCPWPVPPAEGQTTKCFKSTMIFGYDISYIVLVFQDYKFEKATIVDDYLRRLQ